MTLFGKFRQLFHGGWRRGGLVASARARNDEDDHVVDAIRVLGFSSASGSVRKASRTIRRDLEAAIPRAWEVDLRDHMRRVVRNQVFAALVGNIAAQKPDHFINYERLAEMADCAARQAMERWRE